jgi:hypothetical protein
MFYSEKHPRIISGKIFFPWDKTLVYEGQNGVTIERYGLGKRNDRGQR